jgi:hypothetical protein
VIGFLGLLQKAPVGAFDAVKHLSSGSEVQTLVRPRAITLLTQNLIDTLALGGGMQVIQATCKAIGRRGEHRDRALGCSTVISLCADR